MVFCFLFRNSPINPGVLKQFLFVRWLPLKNSKFESFYRSRKPSHEVLRERKETPRVLRGEYRIGFCEKWDVHQIKLKTNGVSHSPVLLLYQLLFLLSLIPMEVRCRTMSASEEVDVTAERLWEDGRLVDSDRRNFEFHAGNY